MHYACEVESARSPAKRLFAPRRDSLFVGLVVGLIGLDQLSKWVIRETVARGDVALEIGPLRVVHVTNSGAAFGILQDSGPLLAVTSILGMVAILVYLFSPSFARPLMRAGLALMLAGAMGNLIDRVAEGRVVDFIKVPNFPAFNVADSSITIGVLLLLWAMLDDSRQTQTQTNDANS
jgi:signal peptidase II